jgi:hypothetical protein
MTLGGLLALVTTLGELFSLVQDGTNFEALTSF